MSFTKKELAECAWRELELRRSNYPRWVRDRKMQQRESDRQIALQQEIYRIIMSLPDNFLREETDVEKNRADPAVPGGDHNNDPEPGELRTSER